MEYINPFKSETTDLTISKINHFEKMAVLRNQEQFQASAKEFENKLQNLQALTNETDSDKKREGIQNLLEASDCHLLQSFKDLRKQMEKSLDSLKKFGQSSDYSKLEKQYNEFKSSIDKDVKASIKLFLEQALTPEFSESLNDDSKRKALGQLATIQFDDARNDINANRPAHPADKSWGKRSGIFWAMDDWKNGLDPESVKRTEILICAAMRQVLPKNLENMYQSLEKMFQAVKIAEQQGGQYQETYNKIAYQFGKKMRREYEPLVKICNHALQQKDGDEDFLEKTIETLKKEGPEVFEQYYKVPKDISEIPAFDSSQIPEENKEFLKSAMQESIEKDPKLFDEYAKKLDDFWHILERVDKMKEMSSPELSAVKEELEGFFQEINEKIVSKNLTGYIRECAEYMRSALIRLRSVAIIEKSLKISEEPLKISEEPLKVNEEPLNDAISSRMKTLVKWFNKYSRGEKGESDENNLVDRIKNLKRDIDDLLQKIPDSSEEKGDFF